MRHDPNNFTSMLVVAAVPPFVVCSAADTISAMCDNGRTDQVLFLHPNAQLQDMRRTVRMPPIGQLLAMPVVWGRLAARTLH